MSRPTLTAADLTELRQLVDRYGDAVDRRDHTGLAELFADGATITVQSDGGPVESQWSEGEMSVVIESVAAYDRTLHHVGGAVFLPGRVTDEASGRVSCLAHHYQRTENGPVDLVMAVRYHDRYTRAERTGWLFSARRVAIEWSELHPAFPLRRR